MEPRTLILNTSYIPSRIATWQNAICLIYQEKADAVESYDAVVSSPSVTLKIPAVARLRKDISTHKRGVKFSRINILTRDGFKCAYCGLKKSPRELNYDHVIPRAQGGRTDFTNIVSACRRCNTRKGSRTPEQAGMPLLYKPHRPKTLPMAQTLLIDVNSAPELWRPYLGIVRHIQSA